MIKKIISGCRTGAERAALDVAFKFGIQRGGWIPGGHKSMSGPLPEKYQFREMATNSYEACLEQNILDSDGTLIIARGNLTADTDCARRMTLKHKKQLLGIDLGYIGHFDGASLAVSWIRLQHVQILNMAGPSATEDRQIYSDVVTILEHVVRIFSNEKRKSEKGFQNSANGKSSILPETVEDAVSTLFETLSLKDKTTIANMAEGELTALQSTLGSKIGTQFGIWTGNQALLNSCEMISGGKYMHPDSAPYVIIRELWKRLRQTHKLRIVK
jgi:hypothetical protein